MHWTEAQQTAINEKNSKAKKAINAKAKQQQALEMKDKAEQERLETSFFDWWTKKLTAARDKLLNFGAPSLVADGQAVDETLTPVNIDDKSKMAKANDEVANNQATKDPVMPTTFSSHPSIKIFDPMDINPIFDK